MQSVAVENTGIVVIRSRAELFAMGMTSRDITRAVSEGSLIRVRRGLYARHDTSDPVVRALQVGGRLACVSVLQAAGVFVFEAPLLHIHLARGASRLRSPGSSHRPLTPSGRDGCALHWRVLADDHNPLDHRVSAVDAMIQAIMCQEPRLAVASIDSALHRGFIQNHQLDVIFFHLPQRLQYLRELIDSRSESGLETVFRLMLVDLGIEHEVQVQVDGVGRVDFVLDGRIAVETDGSRFHGEPTRERDYDRDLALIARGYLVIRVNYRQVFFSPAGVIAALRAALRSHPLSPGS